MKTSRCTDCQIIATFQEADAGTPVPSLCRTHGMNNATLSKRQFRFGGMDASLVFQLNELEDENRRLKNCTATRS